MRVQLQPEPARLVRHRREQPVVAAVVRIIADRDSFQGFRSGNINPLLYALFNLAPALYFHDITGSGQTTTNNGLFPVTPGYDEATGIGTPRMAALITLRP